jgi:[acyl-carrier-protein] S-malonyltransferase
MKPAADQLSVSLESITLKAPVVAVLNNVDVKAETDATAIRNALVRQLYSPVRWTETVEKMAQNGVEVLVEVGPGKVLNGLAKRIVDSLQAVSVNDVKSLDAVNELLA